MATLAGWLTPFPLPSPPGLIWAGTAELDVLADVVGAAAPGVVTDVTTSMVVTGLPGVTVTTGLEAVGCAGAEAEGGGGEVLDKNVVGGVASEEVDVELWGGGGAEDEEVVGGGGNGLVPDGVVCGVVCGGGGDDDVDDGDDDDDDDDDGGAGGGCCC